MPSRAATVAVVLLIAGCANTAVESEPVNRPTTVQTSTPESTATPEPTASPTASPVPFGEEYLALTEPVNAALCEFNTTAQSNPARTDFEPAVASLADALRTFVEGLLAVEWPQETQGAVDELVRAVATHEAALRTALGSTDDNSFFANLSAANAAFAETGGPAQLVRITLGLEGVPPNACD